MVIPARRVAETGPPSLRTPRLPRRSAVPPRGLPLGLSLGLILAVVVSGVLSLTTLHEQRREIVVERAEREALLAESLAPLAEELELAATADAARHLLDAYQQAYLDRGYDDHNVLLLDRVGRPVLTAAGDRQVEPPADALVATAPIRSSLIPGGTGAVRVWQEAGTLEADITRRWRAWWLDLLVTSLAVILAVELAVHLLVGRPLRRLVEGLERFQNGHLAPIETGRGAWEIRWLAWRFEHLGNDLADTARRLVAAERRALDAARQPQGPPAREIPAAGEPPTDDVVAPFPAERELVRQYLDATARLLRSLSPADPTARELAAEAWMRAVGEAERVGDTGLKAELENGALRILEPVAFGALERRLAALRSARSSWARRIVEHLAERLHADHVPVREIQHRVKHTAGVWRKMREHELALDEVHDLFAFRVIVPEEEDCYLALGAVHRAFEPEPFRFKDYITAPKANGYRSLHTSVRDADGHLFEIQIRTVAMHRAAEDGAAAHWRYRARRWSRLDRLRPRHPGHWLSRLLRRG